MMSDPRISAALNESLARAGQVALSMSQRLLMPHHLLLAMLQRPDIQGVIGPYTDPAHLAEQVSQEVLRIFPQAVEPQPAGGMQIVPTQAQSLRHVIGEAMHSLADPTRQLSHEHILLAFTLVEQGGVAKLLRENGLGRHEMAQALAHAPLQSTPLGPQAAPVGPGGDDTAPAPGGSALARYAVDLLAKAKAGKVDPVIGRDTEIKRLVQILARRKKNNPLLVGDPGVGKTAVAEGLAQRILSKQVPLPLQQVELYALNLAALVAGTKFRGDFEQRIQALLDEIKARPQVVLVLDEIHTLLGAGAASGGTLDAANLLKPALASGELRVIGATTFREYRSIFDQDEALSRRFQKVDLAEPSAEDARMILAGVRPLLEQAHGVRYTDAALDAAVALSIRYLPGRQLPDKAIDLLDDAGAQLKLDGASQAQVVVHHIEAVVAQAAQVPVGQLTQNDRTALKTLATDLKATIFGQDHAVDELVRAMKVARADLGNSNQPLAKLLFAGPTGVGKTELARQLAQRMGLKLLRYDMSEYLEPHSIARLIGAPPGYIGHGKGGLLTEEVHQHPHAVVLIDEIEKAHPDIANILLQVMDHGTLTDASGRTVNFRHAVLVLTTNAGASLAARNPLGFVAQDPRADAKLAIEARFPPEFRGRLDAILQFNPLGQAQIEQVLQKNLEAVQTQLRPRGVTLEVTAPVRQWLIEHGYSATLGARPMERLITSTLKPALADALLFGELADGGNVRFELQDGEVIPVFDAVAEAVPA